MDLRTMNSLLDIETNTIADTISTSFLKSILAQSLFTELPTPTPNLVSAYEEGY